MANHPAKKRIRKSSSRQRKRVLIRVGIIAGFILIVMGAIGLTFLLKRPPDPDTLRATAQTQLGSGELSKASRTVRALEKAVGMTTEVRGLKADLLTAEAMKSVNHVERDSSNTASKTPSAPSEDDVDTKDAFSSQAAVRTLSEAMALLELSIQDNAAPKKWDTLLAFHEKRLQIQPSFALAASALKVAERRLANAPNDVPARRLRVIARLFESDNEKLHQNESVKLEIAEDLKAINNHGFSLRIIAQCLAGPQPQADTTQQNWLHDPIAAKATNDPENRQLAFCAKWLQIASNRASQPSPETCSELMELLSMSIVESADWEWAEIACRAYLAIDRRPILKGESITTEGAVAISEILENHPSFSQHGAAKLFIASTRSPESAVTVYREILEGNLKSVQSPDEILDLWGHQLTARNGLLQRLTQLALAQGPNSTAADQARELLSLEESPSWPDRLVDAHLMMAEGNLYEAAAEFQKGFEATKSPQVLYSFAEALLRAQEWGVGLQVLQQAIVSNHLDEGSVRATLIGAAALIRLHAFDAAEHMLNQLDQRLPNIPASKNIRDQLAFHRLVYAPTTEGTDRLKQVEAHIKNKNVSEAYKIRDLISKNQVDAAVGQLKAAKLTAVNLKLWRMVLQRDPGYEATFLSAYETYVSASPKNTVSNLLNSWVTDKRTAHLLASEKLLLAAGIADARQRNGYAVIAIRDLGLTGKQLTAWLDQLPPADKNTASVLAIRLQEAVRNGSWTKAEAYGEQLRKIQKSNLAIDLLDAQIALSRGKADEAALTAQAVADAWPFHSTARYLLATAQLAQGKTQPALTSLQAAISIKPDHERTLLRLFSLYNQTGDLVGAKKVIAAYLRLFPEKQAAEQFAQILGSGKERDATSIAIREMLSKTQPHNTANQAALANLYERNQQPEKAAAILQQLCNIHPQEIKYPVLLASMMVRTGKGAEAKKLIDTTVASIQPTRDKDLIAVAAYYQSIGNTAEASELINRALAAESKTQLSITPQIGLWWFSQRKYAEAMPLLEKTWKKMREPKFGIMAAECALNLNQPEVAASIATAIEIEFPDWFELPRLKASLAYASGDSGQATALIEKAIFRWPNDPNNYVTRARLKAYEGDQQSAQSDFRQALTISPNHVVARLELGQLLLATGQTDAAITVLDGDGYSNLAGSAYQVRQGLLFMKNKRYDLALTQLESARAANPNDEMTLHALMPLYDLMENYPKAGECAQLLLEKLPGNPLVGKNNLAYYLAMSGDAKQSLALSESIVKEAKTAKSIPASHLANFWDTLGVCRVCAGDLSGAIDAFRRALAIVPLNDARLHLAQSLAATGTHKEALSLIKPAFQAMQENLEADRSSAIPLHFQLAVLEVLIKSEAIEDAESHATKLLVHDLSIADQPIARAKLLALLAEISFRKDPKNGQAAAIAKLRQSLNLATTMHGLTLMIKLDAAGGSEAAAQLAKLKKNKPNAYFDSLNK